jgi:aminoglycoside N3'-acetyltransferase
VNSIVDRDLYDTLRTQNERLRKQVEQLTAERDQALKDLREALFIKADAVAKQGDGQGEARITDQKLIQDFVIDSLKVKPNQVIIKWTGSIVTDVRGVPKPHESKTTSV